MNPNKALWEKGDFTRIAESMRESGEALDGAEAVEEGGEVVGAHIEHGSAAGLVVELGAGVPGLVAAALFVLGVIGVLTRRNVVIVLMSIELILNAVNLNLVAFSRMWGLHGQVFAIFVITDAAAEAAVGLGILIAFFRNKETVNVDEVDLMKW